MTSSKRKQLVLLRRGLVALAAVLFCLALFSGYMAFFSGGKAPQAPLDATEASETLPTETTQATTVPTKETTAPTEEVTTPPEEIQKDESVSGNGSHHNKENTPTEKDADVLPDDGDAEEGATVAETGETPVTSPTDDTLPAGDDSPALFSQGQEISGSPNGEPMPPNNSAAQEAAQQNRNAPKNNPVQLPWILIFWCATGLLALDLTAILLIGKSLSQMPEESSGRRTVVVPRTLLSTPIPAKRPLSIGTLHQPGRRQYQQDSLGHSLVLGGKGVLAVLADGMGGLKDGDKVSQQIVLRTLELGEKLRADQTSGVLYRMLNQVNEEINQMLTPEGLYKCGSTMIAVLVQERSFQWISVGDSRIYLYREGYVNRLNRDHDLLQEWMPEILNGQRDMESSLADPNARKLTSFIGMGRLKYVDGSLRPIDILPGDRIVLLSDGVYGEVSEAQLAAILKQYPDVRQAAAMLDRQVKANQNPHQDNYTALILGF